MVPGVIDQRCYVRASEVIRSSPSMLRVNLCRLMLSENVDCNVGGNRRNMTLFDSSDNSR